jgi:hypothetical protein
MATAKDKHENYECLFYHCPFWDIVSVFGGLSSAKAAQGAIDTASVVFGNWDIVCQAGI